MTDIDAYIQPAAATTWLAAHVVFATSWTLATADQENAALVEEMSATAMALKEQSGRLSQSVGAFQVNA